MAQLAVTKLELTKEQEEALANDLHDALTPTLEAHSDVEKHFATLRDAYKGKPEQDVKNYPWKGAANVVVPLVSIVVDAIVARLMKSVLAVKSPFNVEIKSKEWEGKEKDVTDWCEYFLITGGTRDKLRDIFFDLALNGDAFVKPMWVEKKRKTHQYDASYNVVAKDVIDYEGPMWFVPSPSDVVAPTGYDDWDELPFWALRLRYTDAELQKLQQTGEYKNLDEILKYRKERTDLRGQNADNEQKTTSKSKITELLEVWGLFEVPQIDEEGKLKQDLKLEERDFRELILTYHVESKKFVKLVENPFFGRVRFMKKVPYLVQAHELRSESAANQALPGQREASTIHNQVIDAATAANGGILVTSPQSNIANEEQVWPGKKIVDEHPEKVQVLHLSEPSPALQRMEEVVIRYTETKTGVSAYHLGMESTVVGSQATATGTTALINEGNNRFWVSIDDMRDALVETLYMTIQLIQQMKPEGVEIAPGRIVTFPQGDVKSSMGLKLQLASESVNRDVELQNMQILMAVLNEYYARLMNASAMILNPQFPPEQKKVALSIMASAQTLVQKFVEKFPVEDITTIVPDLRALLTQVGAQGGQAPGAVQPPVGPGAQGAPGPVPVGAEPLPQPA